MKAWLVAVSFGVGGLSLAGHAWGHGEIGQRIFPPTITTEDPFAVDEFSLSGSFFVAPAEGGAGGGRTEQLSGGFEFDKEILPRLAVGVEGAYLREHTSGAGGGGGGNRYGWDNFGVHVKYELWQNVPHEAIVSIGLDADLGGTGTNGIGESATTFTPTLFFGKGMGDLPDTLSALQPVALTGTIGQSFPTDVSEPNALRWGLALEYSLPYLQSRGGELPAWAARAIPLCEFSFDSPENRDGGVTTGTINPGVLLEFDKFQLGAEALIPVNAASGSQVGAIVNLQIFLDDAAPAIFGHPLFGARP